MSAAHHPTAIIAPGAEIGADCTIGPYCVIGAHVKLGPGCVLHSHVVLEGHLTLGAECQVFPFACLGSVTQDKKFRGEVSYVTVGDRTVIREYVTIHAATTGGVATSVGSDCLILAYCHIAHDCVVGNGVIMSNAAMLAGHVQVGDYAVIGGMAGVVQFVRIGTMAMLGGYSKLAQDLAPFCIAEGQPAVTRTVNKVGLERRGRDEAAVHAVRDAYKAIFRSGLRLEDALAQLRAQHPASAEIAALAEFCTSSKLGLARPASD